MSLRYPNADYPTAYDEADMVKGTDIPVNVAGGNLTVTTAGAGQGPLLGDPVTAKDVRTDLSRDSAPKAKAETPAVAEEVIATEDI